jgi:hypothetical protein
MHAVSRSRTVASLVFRSPPRPSRLFLTPVAALVFLPLASLFPPSLAQASAPPAGIIAADGGRFVDPSDGSTFTVVGANCYYLAYSSSAEEGSYEHTWVTQVLDEAESLGLNVIRVWAFQDQWWEGERALQPGPEVYNERFLVALDGLLAQASSRGLRLLLCMTNYWEDYGANDTAVSPGSSASATCTPHRAADRSLTSLVSLTPHASSHRHRRCYRVRQVGASGWRARTGRQSAPPPRGLFHLRPVSRMVQSARDETRDQDQHDHRGGV